MLGTSLSFTRFYCYLLGARLSFARFCNTIFKLDFYYIFWLINVTRFSLRYRPYFFVRCMVDESSTWPQRHLTDDKIEDYHFCSQYFHFKGIIVPYFMANENIKLFTFSLTGHLLNLLWTKINIWHDVRTISEHYRE